jgi:hypothetical protein
MLSMLITGCTPFPPAATVLLFCVCVLGELLALSIENLQHFWLNLLAAMRNTFTSIHQVYEKLSEVSCYLSSIQRTFHISTVFYD